VALHHLPKQLWSGHLSFQTCQMHRLGDGRPSVTAAAVASWCSKRSVSSPEKRVSTQRTKGRRLHCEAPLFRGALLNRVRFSWLPEVSVLRLERISKMFTWLTQLQNFTVFIFATVLLAK
jgi:hypothetical protein